MKKKKIGNKGSTLILVMVAMGFIGLLGASVLAASAINNTMKEVNKEAKENFYTADAVMEKIKSGLVLTSSEASMTAYENVLSNYTTITENSAISMQEVFNQSYMKEIKKKLCGGDDSISGDFFYQEDKIKGFLTEEEKTFYCSTVGENKLEMKPLEHYMVLKNIEVKVKNGNYETKIKTDIRLQTPKLSFSKGTAGYTEFSKYALIADNKIKMNHGKTTVNGNVYSGIVRSKDPTSIEDKTAGIEVLNGGILELLGDSVVSRGDIAVSNGGNLKIGDGVNSKKSNVWVENIRTGKELRAAPAKITINGTINVADDLELNGAKDEVTLRGEYFGYHYDKEYTQNYLPQTNAEYSSSMIINGKDALLNMKDLSMLVLAGRAFISKSGSDSEFLAQNKDIMLGESLAVRSSQLVYYVPEKYVVEEKSGGEKKLDVPGYENYVGFPVDSYLFSEPEKMLVPYYLKNAGGTICYYYLNFKNEAAANDFYREYFKFHPEVIKNNSSPYFSEEGISLNPSMILLLSGNILYRDPTTKRAGVKISNQSTPSKIMKMYAQSKGQEYKSRQLALVEDLQEAQGGDIRILDKTQNSLYKRMVKFDKIDELHGITQQPISVNEKGGELGKIFVSDKENYTWTGENGNKGIIICNGNVEIVGSFQGMVLAGGDITFSQAGGSTITGDEYLIQNMLHSQDSSKMMEYLKIDLTEKKVNITADFDYEGYVYYENWKKNGK
ncbi:MAG: hypothetical protein RSB37_07260 [Acetivibrio sp.]